MDGNIVCTVHAVRIWSAFQQVKGSPLAKAAAALTLVEAEALDAEKAAKVKAHRHNNGTIYYLLVGDWIKIGFTSNLDRRLTEYPANAELLVTHPGTRAEETDLHRSFSPSLAHGREWYFQTPEVMAHVVRVKQEADARLLAARSAPEPPRPNPFASSAQG